MIIQRRINLFSCNEINFFWIVFWAKKNELWIYYACNLEIFSSLIYDKDKIWSCRKFELVLWMNCVFYKGDEIKMRDFTIVEETFSLMNFCLCSTYSHKWKKLGTNLSKEGKKRMNHGIRSNFVICSYFPWRKGN